ncbi:MAG: hypothetical protein ACJ77Z_18510 [Thermoleophilaceae bacterium]
MRSDQTLVDLHTALQAAFGCADDHLYWFWLSDQVFGTEAPERHELGNDRIELSELVVLGARERPAQVRSQREDAATRRRRLADRVRNRSLPVDRDAATEVRRSGWAR